MLVRPPVLQFHWGFRVGIGHRHAGAVAVSLTALRNAIRSARVWLFANKPVKLYYLHLSGL